MPEPLIRKLEQFEKLPNTCKQVLQEAIREVRQIGPRQDIIQEGDKPRDVHLVLEGWAARYKLLGNGNRAIMAYLIPGDLCDVQVTLLNRMDHSIGTLSSCKVAYIARERMDAMLTEHQRLSRAIWWSVLVDEAILREWLVNAGQRPANGRLAHFICEMLLRAKAVGLTEDDSFVLPLTQEELGDTMGLSTVHVNRTLQELRARGLIESRGKRLIVNDLDHLIAFADYNPNYLHQHNPRA